jgi:hypothetical protein
LSASAAGFVDYADRFGRELEGGVESPPGAIYLRRWSIRPLPVDPNTLVIQVVVARTTAGETAEGPVRSERVRLLTVKARKPR